MKLTTLKRKLIQWVLQKLQEQNPQTTSAEEQWCRMAASNAHLPNNLYMKRFSAHHLTRTVDVIRKRYADNSICICYDEIDASIRFSLNGTNITFVHEKEFFQEPPSPNDIYLLAFQSDEKLYAALQYLNKTPGSVFFTPRIGFPPARYFQRDDVARDVIRDYVSQFAGRGHIDISYFENLLQAVHRTAAIDGCYLEIGVYKGGSSRLVLEYMRRKKIQKHSYLLDTFEGFTYAEAETSSDRSWSNSHNEVTQQEVLEFLKGFDAKSVIKSNCITDPLPADIHSVACCNIDVDMYEAVQSAFRKVAPRMALGGIIISQDQGYTPWLAGAYQATQEFLESPLGRSFMPIHLTSGQMYFVRYRMD